jgi:hypothetical protein
VWQRNIYTHKGYIAREEKARQIFLQGGGYKKQLSLIAQLNSGRELFARLSDLLLLTWQWECMQGAEQKDYNHSCREKISPLLKL